MRTATMSLVRRSRASTLASTLVELQMGIAILVLVLGAVCGSHIFGLRMFYQTKLSLEATDQSRKVLGALREEIRGCAIVQVGTASIDTSKPPSQWFNELADDTPQVGNALQIFPGTNRSSFVLYYHETNNTICRWSTTTKRFEVLGHNVTNVNVFRTTDYGGNVLTNNENNRVVEITLKFLQERGKGAQQKGGLHNYYQVQTKATRRKVL